MDLPLLKYQQLPSSSYKLSKEVLKTCTVIGQVSCQFIALHWPEETAHNPKTVHVGLVDQHAAAERVLLEHLFSENLTVTPPHTILPITLYQPFQIKFIPDIEEFMMQEQGIFATYGFQYIQNNGKGINFLKIPRLLCTDGDKVNMNERLFNERDLVALIEDIISLDQHPDNITLSNLPQHLQNIINTMACKKSVRFGDYLSKSQCEKIIRELSTCQLPLQCAHGRPTIVPLTKIQCFKCTK